MARLFSRPLAPVAAAAALVIVALGVYISRRQAPGPQPAPRATPHFQWAPSDQFRTPDATLPVGLVTGGITGTMSSPIPELAADTRIVLKMSLDFATDIGSSYEIVVYDFGRAELWRDDIPQEHVDAGELFLELNGQRLGPGAYHIQIVANESAGFATVVAESGFRLLD